ncbi:DNA-binding transcriptional regulator, Lrp family [Thermomonospora echinospora]|uniref:DNA-binding transcriptional regulator, Lrp family n=1 Tax=Thermomonospora echinospora TaxID=1992 RepID=A0A1H6AAX1_9ACTN|nr:DNA-binding transcriptional regulator, Lrp family [Thermomonospora echinospora]
MPIDELDGRVIELFTAEPRIGVLEASRRLGVARGTVQARLDRLARDGVIRGYGPQVDPGALGYGVTAFVTLQIRQPGGHDPVAERLAAIPEVIEAHTITGAGDMLCRIVARSNADLQRVIDLVVAVSGVERASSVISLATQIPFRTLPLVRAVSGTDGGDGGGGQGGSGGGRDGRGGGERPEHAGRPAGEVRRRVVRDARSGSVGSPQAPA